MKDKRFQIGKWVAILGIVIGLAVYLGYKTIAYRIYRITENIRSHTAHLSQARASTFSLIFFFIFHYYPQYWQRGWPQLDLIYTGTERA